MSVEVKPALFVVVNVTLVPFVLEVILDISTVFVTGPDTSSLPPVPDIVTLDVYQPFEPKVPTILKLPAVGAVLSTLIVTVSVEVKPALLVVVNVTLVPSVLEVILDISTVFVTGPDTSSLPPFPDIVTLDVYQPFEPSVPTISNVPTVGAVLSTLTV